MTDSRLPHLTREEWAALYASSSLRELGRRFGVSHEAVRLRLQAVGVVLRSRGEGGKRAIAEGKRPLRAGYRAAGEVTCEWCGVRFRRAPCYDERRPHHYCSLTCSARGRVQGQQERGEALTWEAVREIRERAAAGERQKDIARRFGITQANVSRIVRGETWREEPGTGG